MIRELITRLNRSLSEKMVPTRHPFAAPMKVWFEPEVNSERAVDAARSACILGETIDLSRNGVAFSVPFIRLKEKYLVNQDRILNVEIDLPNGKVVLKMLGKRYEKIGMHSSQERFLVGATILSIPDTDKEIYETFLKKGDRRRNTTAERVGIAID